MKYKNYYKILELNSDRVSDEEIKLAYRKLAKKYHPDINPDDAVASEKFKLVNEAYQVLGNVESKKKYDRIHNVYRVKDVIEDTKQKLNQEGFSDMFEMMFGKKEEIKTNSKNKKMPLIGEDLESTVEITFREAFFGTQKDLAFRTIDGSLKTINLKVPKGIRNGEKIRIANHGKPGKNGGEPGDLYIKVMIKKEDNYKLVGSDIYMDLKLSPWEAALGTNVDIQNIDSTILVKVPGGIQTGEKLRISGSGFWDAQDVRGDLFLNVQVMVPKDLSNEERALFEGLSKTSNFDPRNNITKEKE